MPTNKKHQPLKLAVRGTYQPDGSQTIEYVAVHESWCPNKGSYCDEIPFAVGSNQYIREYNPEADLVFLLDTVDTPSYWKGVSAYDCYRESVVVVDLPGRNPRFPQMADALEEESVQWMSENFEDDETSLVAATIKVWRSYKGDRRFFDKPVYDEYTWRKMIRATGDFALSDTFPQCYFVFREGALPR